MFSQKLITVESQVAEIARDRTQVDLSEIISLAADRHKMELDQLWRLLHLDPGGDAAAYKALLHLTHDLKRSAYQGNVFAIVPLYVTSICQEHCVYCNYRVENCEDHVERLRLTSDQIEQEARFLIEDKGLRVIELVYATDPAIRASQICEHVQVVRRLLDESGGGIVGINAEPFDFDDYVQLRSAGVEFAVLWQETYQREIYHHLHPGATKKADFDYRLDTFDRMIQAGIRNVGLGVLSGVAPWELDWLLLIAHERFLQEQYGVTPAIFGTPRLKSAPGAQMHSTPFIPNDEEYLLAIAVHNLTWPSALPFINTREEWDLCVKASAGGGALFTFDCKTIPGGYTMGNVGCQFPTFSYDARVYRQRLSETGLNPVFSWTFNDIQQATATEAVVSDI